MQSNQLEALKDQVRVKVVPVIPHHYYRMLKTSMGFIKEDEHVTVCEFLIGFDAHPEQKRIPVDGFIEILEALKQEFCIADPNQQPIWVGGYPWYIGDQDDSGAVSFANGRIHIWVRTWYKTLEEIVADI